MKKKKKKKKEKKKEKEKKKNKHNNKSNHYTTTTTTTTTNNNNISNKLPLPPRAVAAKEKAEETLKSHLAKWWMRFQILYKEHPENEKSPTVGYRFEITSFIRGNRPVFLSFRFPKTSCPVLDLLGTCTLQHGNDLLFVVVVVVVFVLVVAGLFLIEQREKRFSASLV